MEMMSWLVEAMFTGACWQAEDDFVINTCYSQEREFSFQWTF